MKSKIIIVSFLWFALNADIAINTANQAPTVAFDIQSGLTSQGVLMLRMAILVRTVFSNPAEYLLVCDTGDKSFYHYSSSIIAWNKLRKI